MKLLRRRKDAAESTFTVVNVVQTTNVNKDSNNDDATSNVEQPGTGSNPSHALDSGINQVQQQQASARPASSPADTFARLRIDEGQSSTKRAHKRLSAVFKLDHVHFHHRGHSLSHYTGGGGGGNRSNSSTVSSIHVPNDLPEIITEPSPAAGGNGEQPVRQSMLEQDAIWQERAFRLADKEHEFLTESGDLSLLSATSKEPGNSENDAHADGDGERSILSVRSNGSVNISTQDTEDRLQRAIELHESGKLSEATILLAELASPDADNNPLAQLLYGLALRHGWGLDSPDPARAIGFLRMAASNSAFIEEQAKKSNLQITTRNQKTSPGRAKGELVLAIYELANCFRYGWGVEIDAVAAKQYYETAAHLGDPDAMTEVGWCLLEGFGCKKDVFQAAQFYRMAEKAGKIEVGSSWIWKEKYDPTPENMDKALKRSIRERLKL
ncbi:hypothetical protein V1514DRAFT_289058 [Lipomyces japonicus]|uniref:uncharacterized protein n=1 Tax=Lipomyces japonicus TaxID=56871 RepID=UPI0034CFAC69